MALANQQQVEALAENLMECADAIHQRLMKAIKHNEVDRIQAQALFQDETILRQRANGLYIDAANSLVENLAASQDDLLHITQSAKNTIQNVKDIAQYIDIVADLLVFVASVYAAKPAPILAAVKEIAEDLMVFDKHKIENA